MLSVKCWTKGALQSPDSKNRHEKKWVEMHQLGPAALRESAKGGVCLFTGTSLTASGPRFASCRDGSSWLHAAIFIGAAAAGCRKGDGLGRGPQARLTCMLSILMHIPVRPQVDPASLLACAYDGTFMGSKVDSPVL